MMNEPLYIASTQGQVDGCNDDSNCDQYMPFAKCHTTASDPANRLYKGLCYSTNETMFITSATEATSASTTEMTSTEESTTMAETIEASSMTTEETTMGTEETTMGSEETTMGMTTEETTMGMTTEETTMEASTTTTPFYNPMTDIIRTNITNMHNYRRCFPDVQHDIGARRSSLCEHTAHPWASSNQQFWRVIKSQSINPSMVFSGTLIQNEYLQPFTQMAWATTKQFGCGVKLCGSNYVVVCRYSPRGNIPLSNIYNVGTKCTACPNSCSTEYLYQGLCMGSTMRGH
ncbi:hypothetical protein OSTOST_03629 [Ostertagia ostertagi]